MKSRSDPSGQRFSFFDCFSALRAVADVVRQGLAFVRAKSIKKVIIQSLFCLSAEGQESIFVPAI
jgi:hypothetical protein